MLKLKLQYFAHLMRRSDSFEMTLMLGQIEGGRRRGRRSVRWLDGITEQVLGVRDGQASLACCGPRGRKELDMTEQLNNHSKNLPDGTQLLSGRVHTGTQTVQL